MVQEAVVFLFQELINLLYAPDFDHLLSLLLVHLTDEVGLGKLHLLVNAGHLTVDLGKSLPNLAHLFSKLLLLA
ncbi:MAG: hypothetical protein ACK55I_24060, partial [bacterium]